MGVSKPILLSSSSSFFLLLLLISNSLIIPSFADNDSRTTTPPIDEIATTNPSPPPPQERPNFSPFKPSIAVIVGVLTIMFSVTFLLLLYAKHCKRANGQGYHDSRGGAGAGFNGRKNSGIDQAVIESLPVFRFGSLRGQKNGLECAVCLTRFEPNEVLRLLPKCKHAFHVECVDTWLDAHSSCPLCRYRVDPEDVLLIEDCKFLHENPQPHAQQEKQDLSSDIECKRSGAESTTSGFRRVSGRHSSAGERASNGLLQIVLQRPGENDRGELGCSSRDPSSFRRSFDSYSISRKKSESVAVGCFDRPPRKDGLLLIDGLMADRKSFERRFEHRIIVSGGGSSGLHQHHKQRWSDVQPSDLLYLRSEMIISDSLRLSLESEGSRPSVNKQHQKMQLPLYMNSEKQEQDTDESGRSVINSRSVSEITGLSRFSSRASNSSHHHHRQRQTGVVSRWLAWVSSQSHPVVRLERSAALSSLA